MQWRCEGAGTHAAHEGGKSDGAAHLERRCIADGRDRATREEKGGGDAHVAQFGELMRDLEKSFTRLGFYQGSNSVAPWPRSPLKMNPDKP